MLQPLCRKIPVATVIQTHGVNGELTVELTPPADPVDDFRPGEPLIAEIDGLDVPFFIGSVRPRGPQSLLLTLDEVRSEADAADLLGHTLYVYTDASATADDDGFDSESLVGYQLIDADRGPLGPIADIVELGPGCWYFTVQGLGVHIPIVDEFFQEVDPRTRTVRMQLPQGLLEL